MSDLTKSQRYAWIIISLISAILVVNGAIAVHAALGRPLEFDEIWTLSKYASLPNWIDVFQDITVPNNHILNSLILQKVLSSGLFSASIVRISSAVIPAALTLPIVALLSRRLVKTTHSWPKHAAVQAMACALCASSPWFIRYAQTARGYALQSMLITLLVYLLFVMYDKREASPWSKRITEIGAFSTTACAVVHIPTSFVLCGIPWLIFGAITLRNQNYQFKNTWSRYTGPICSGICTAIFSVGWLLEKSSQFKIAKDRVGTSANLWEKIEHGAQMPFTIFGAIPLIALIVLAVVSPSKKILLITAGSGAAILGIALAGGNPPRIFIAVVPLLSAALAASMLENPTRVKDGTARRAFPIVVSTLVLSYIGIAQPYRLEQVRPINCGILQQSLEKRYAKNGFVAYSACGSLEVSQAQVMADPKNYLHKLPQQGHLLIVPTHEGLEGLHATTKAVIPISLTQQTRITRIDNKTSVFEYRLTTLTDHYSALKPILCIIVIEPMSPEQQSPFAELIPKAIDSASLLIINSHQTQNVSARLEHRGQWGVYAQLIPTAKISACLQLQKKSNDSIRFFKIDPISP